MNHYDYPAIRESGSAYQILKDRNSAESKALLLSNKKLEAEILVANKQIATQYTNWLDVFYDVKAECNEQLKAKDKTIEELKREVAKKDAEIFKLKENLKNLTEQFANLSAQLEESEGMCQKLHAQINRDFHNSSISSSISINSNSREKSGKHPGGQPDHPSYHRKIYEPTKIRYIEPTEKFSDMIYTKTGKEAYRQLVNIRVMVDVLEHRTPTFRDKR